MLLSEDEIAGLIRVACWRNTNILGMVKAEAATEAAHAISERLAEGAKSLRECIAEWYEHKGYDASPQTLMLGLMEEVGELAQAILLTECADFQVSRHKQRGELGDLERHKDIALEIGDVLTYLMALCNRLDVDPKMRAMDGQTIEVTVRSVGPEKANSSEQEEGDGS